MAATTSNTALNQYSASVSGGTTPNDLFIRDVPDWIDTLETSTNVFLKMVGGLKGGAPSVPMNKAEWGWGSDDPMQGTLDEALNNSDTTFDVVDSAVFQVGDIIRIDAEHMRVTALPSATTITVGERGFRGTSNVSHDNASTIYKIGIAIAENADDPLSPITQGELDFNYHEIVIFNWQMSQRAKVTPTYESRNKSGNRFEQELKKKMNRTAPNYLERMLLEGLRFIGTSTVPSTMGGLQQPSYITTRNTVAGSGPLTERDLLDTVQDVWDLVGSEEVPSTVMLAPFAKLIVNSWYNDSRRTGGGDSKISVKFDSIDTDFGTIKFVTNPTLSKLGRSNELYLLDPKHIQLRPYASSTGWTTGMIKTDGWYERGFLRADVTATFQNPDSRGALTGFSTSTADYPSLA